MPASGHDKITVQLCEQYHMFTYQKLQLIFLYKLITVRFSFQRTENKNMDKFVIKKKSFQEAHISKPLKIHNTIYTFFLS